MHRFATAGLFGSLAAALILTTAPASADFLPPGEPVDNGLAANLTPSGLSFLAEKAKGLVPSTFPLGDQTNSGFCQDFELTHASIAMSIDNIKLTPQAGNPGFLKLDLAANVWGGGTDTVPGDTTVYNNVIGRLTFDFCIVDCDNPDYSLIRMAPPIPGTNSVVISTNLFLELKPDPQTGRPAIEASTDLTTNDIAVNLGPINGQGCSVVTILDDLINCCLGGLLENLIAQQVVDLVHNDLIPAIEDGFDQVQFNDVIELADAGLLVDIYPSGLDIRDNGMTIIAASLFEAQPPAKCSTVEVPGSRYTDGPVPQYSTTGPIIGPYHAGISVSDDLVNQLLYAAWDAGLLCMDLDEFGSEPLDASFLALAGMSQALTRMETPETAPLLIFIRGKEPPYVDYATDPVVNLHVERLELGLMTEVHARQARIVALDIKADAGIDLAIDTAGELQLDLDLPSENLIGTVSYDEVLGPRDAESLTVLLPVMVESFLPDLGDLIPGINFGDLGGVGLEDTVFVQDGGSGDFFSAYTRLIDTAPGCGSGTGCGLDLGTCNVQGAHGASERSALGTLLACLLLLAICPLGLVWWRRRRLLADSGVNLK